MTRPRVYNLGNFFSGSGYKTLGLLRSISPAGSRFRSCLAIDVDPLACQDFERLTGEKAHCLDLGKLTKKKLRELSDGEPDFIVMSPPCKGFSGCLPESASKEERYQDLNRLALTAVKLAIHTWKRKPRVIALENVPRMLTRGSELLEQMIEELRRWYDWDLRPHDCGEWGGLAQRRERLLLVARLRSACPNFLLTPPNLGLRPMS